MAKAVACPECRNKIAATEINPVADIVYCKKCGKEFSYREMEKNRLANSGISMLPGIVRYESLPDGGFILKRKMLRLSIICFSISIAAAAFGGFIFISKQRLPFLTWAGAILVLWWLWNNRQILTWDAVQGIFKAKAGWKCVEIAAGQIAAVELSQLGRDDDSFAVCARDNSGADTILFKQLKEKDAEMICDFIKFQLLRGKE